MRGAAVADVVKVVWLNPANRHRRVRQVLRALEFRSRAHFLRRPTVVPLGRRSTVYAIHDAASSSRAAYANPPDWPEMVVWRRVLHPGDLFVDVGANVGLYTIWALDCGADVVAVEPNPENVRQLRRNLDLNGYEAEIVTAALSNVSGTAGLAGSDLNRQHLLFDEDPGVSEVARVDVRTLDSVLGDRKAAGVKVDVEGAEKLVLQGARRALSSERISVIQLEWNRTSLDLLGEDRSPVVELLDAFGYRLCTPDGAGNLKVAASLEFGADLFAASEGAAIELGIT